MPPTVILMHPRRWGAPLALLDDTHRPLFVPASQGPMNVGGLLTDVDSQQVVGNMQGLPVVTDPNIATNLGYSTIEDAIFVMRVQDLILYEGGLRLRALAEPKADQLSVLLQCFSYFAFSAGRQPASVVMLTGLTAPTW
jgi:hypothetical protein